MSEEKEIDYKLCFKALKHLLDTTGYNINLFCHCGKHYEVIVQEREFTIRIGLRCWDCERDLWISEIATEFYEAIG